MDNIEGIAVEAIMDILSMEGPMAVVFASGDELMVGRCHSGAEVYARIEAIPELGFPVDAIGVRVTGSAVDLASGDRCRVEVTQVIGRHRSIGRMVYLDTGEEAVVNLNDDEAPGGDLTDLMRSRLAVPA